MNKYTMKIFDNETGKLVNSIDFNTLVAGYSHERNGKKLGGSYLDSYGTLEDLGIALHSADLAQQAQIKDKQRRNDVLETFGTTNYDWKYQQALKDEKDEERREVWRKALLNAGAEELESPYGTGHKQVDQMQLEKFKPGDMTALMLDGIKYYFGFSYGWCYLLCEQVKQEMPEETEEERHQREKAERREEEKRENRAYLDEAAKHAYRLRTQFIISISEQTCRDHVNDIIAFLTKRIWASGQSVGGSWQVDKIQKYMGEIFKTKEAAAQKMAEYYAWIHPHKALLWNACAFFDDADWRKYHDTNAEYTPNRALDEFYEFLEKLGYCISREEREMMNGTHERFMEDEDDEEFLDDEEYIDED